jgi:hypothetical protein
MVYIKSSYWAKFLPSNVVMSILRNESGFVISIGDIIIEGTSSDNGSISKTYDTNIELTTIIGKIKKRSTFLSLLLSSWYRSHLISRALLASFRQVIFLFEISLPVMDF